LGGDDGNSLDEGHSAEDGRDERRPRDHGFDDHADVRGEGAVKQPADSDAEGDRQRQGSTDDEPTLPEHGGANLGASEPNGREHGEVASPLPDEAEQAVGDRRRHHDQQRRNSQHQQVDGAAGLDHLRRLRGLEPLRGELVGVRKSVREQGPDRCGVGPVGEIEQDGTAELEAEIGVARIASDFEETPQVLLADKQTFIEAGGM
jgi:hypothetical protein